MSTQVTVTGFQAAIAAAGDAVLAGDWVTAEKQLAIAELINAGLEVEVSSTGAGGATVKRRESLEKTRAVLQALKDQIQQAQGGSRIIGTRTNYPKRRGWGGVDAWR